MVEFTTMKSPRSVAVVGAAGASGRQLVTQLLDRSTIHADARLQLVGHRGGASEHELRGLRADLRDAFADDAPTIDLAVDADQVDADVVVMLAGATVARDLSVAPDRAALAAANRVMFEEFADALAARSGEPPIVIVQSNPVELGVQVFSERLGRSRVVGAGAWSDTLRFRREIADSLGVRRAAVDAMVLGQHGDNMVPLWSRVSVGGIDDDVLGTWIDSQRAGRDPSALATEIADNKSRLLKMVVEGSAEQAFSECALLPADLRAAVKPFLVHFTSGHTTEIVTAHAVAEILEIVLSGETQLMPLQVNLAGEFHDMHGVCAVPVVLGSDGWSDAALPGCTDQELAMLLRAFAAINNG